ENIRDVVAEVYDIEIPDLADSSRPAHPLDPGPLIQNVARLSGATLSLSLVAARQLLGMADAPIGGAAQAAGIISILQGIPIIRNGLRRLLGRDAADVAVAAPSIVSLAASQNPLGLALIGAGSLRMLTEVIPQRAAWKRYEARLDGFASAHRGA